VIIAFGIGFTILLSALLITKSNKWAADWILLIWFIINVIHQSIYYLHTEILEAGNPASLFQFPFPYLHGPLLYLYISANINKLPKRNFIYLIHALPAIVISIILVYIFLLTEEGKNAITENAYHNYFLFFKVYFYSIVASGVIYISFAIIRIMKFKDKLQEQLSSIRKFHLPWLYGLIVGMLLIWIMVLFSNEKVIFSLVSINIALTGFFGLKFSHVFIDFRNYQQVELPEKKVKYFKSGLTIELKKEIELKLNDVMKHQKLYTENELTLQKLSNKLEVRSHHVSQYLNEEFETTFYEFINNLRVNEFIHITGKNLKKNYNILAIALECGFNSKASFNRHFKRITGKTPTEYLKNDVKKNVF
jgi:AraC-like DNA-binding protein